VLCDRVAILKRGRLEHVGYLDELRQQIPGRSGVEVVISGIDEATLRPQLPAGNDFSLTTTPAGLRVEVGTEKEVDAVIVALRTAGGKLVSVQPLRQSLEELFLD
jgi:ABC-2 type transport system ATP-binding protein